MSYHWSWKTSPFTLKGNAISFLVREYTQKDKKKVTRQSISNNIEKTNCTLFLFRVQSADHEERERGEREIHAYVLIELSRKEIN